MTDEELIAKLLAYAKDQGGWVDIDDTCEAAADAIARLTRERDEARAEAERVKSDSGYIIGWNAGWDEAHAQLDKFPTMLRKMWSGTEVQKWLNDQRKHVQRAAAKGGAK